MASEFLLEIGTEEIPARMAPKAAQQLGQLFTKELKALGLDPGSVETASTPRRLVLIARGVAEGQPDRVEEKLGPATRIAFDADGNPTKAGMGFARGQGVDPSALEVIETPKGTYVGVHKHIAGRPTAVILAELLPKIIERLSFPKSMRWGTEPVPFVRPIHWIVALFGGEIVPFSYANVASASKTRGHRFLAPDEIDVDGIDSYLAKLRAADVVLDATERRRSITASLDALATELGGTWVQNAALLDEVVHLVEQPSTTLGRFDPAFLEMPKEVLISAMAKHQRYFAFAQEDGALLDAFAVVSNTRAGDQDVVTRGNERVLHARLSDAQFFFGADRKRALADFVQDLELRVFLKPLGTMRAKADRIARLAGLLADRLAPSAREDAERAGLLAKADLPTQVVAEFPDLQGVMGREYARLSGERDAVATAIFEHYLPRSADDILPATDAGAIVALADKADSIAGCFGVGLVPSGTQDPYALRRQALGIVRILIDHDWTVSVRDIIGPAIEGYGDLLQREAGPLLDDIVAFVRGRLRNMLRDDYAVDVVDAVLEVDPGRVLDAIAKVKALATLRAEEGFEPLAAAFKRVGNIIKDAAPATLRPEALVENAERALHEAHARVALRVAGFIERRDFDAALRAVAELKPDVDGFFDNVMVMVDDEAIRTNRLALLQSVAGTFRQLAEFGRIQVDRG